LSNEQVGIQRLAPCGKHTALAENFSVPAKLLHFESRRDASPDSPPSVRPRTFLKNNSLKIQFIAKAGTL
jgi:hypothetical protein